MEFSSCGLERRNMWAYNLHPFVTAIPLHLCSAPIAFLVTALPQHYCEKIIQVSQVLLKQTLRKQLVLGKHTRKYTSSKQKAFARLSSKKSIV